MKLIDTHCHLFLEEFDADRDELITEAKESGIGALLLPNIDETTIERLCSLCDLYPDFIYPMMGLHPTSVDKDYVQKLDNIESQLSGRKYCAIGEIGIDLYWDKSFLREQKCVFEEQLRWSIAYSLPVSIHTRDAFPEVFDSIYKVGAENISGVFHSFAGTEEYLKEIERLGNFNIGINGIVTFKNAGLSDILNTFDLNRVVLETDAPYLAPVPYRGKRNIPIHIWDIAKKVAEVYSIAMEEVVSITERNAQRLFSLKI